MNFPAAVSGWQRLTSSGAVSDIGKPVIVCGYSIDSSGGGVALPVFFNGTTASAPSVVAFKADNSQGAASTSRTVGLPLPVMLQGGCFVSFDANTAAVTVFYTLAS